MFFYRLSAWTKAADCFVCVHVWNKFIFLDLNRLSSYSTPINLPAVPQLGTSSRKNCNFCYTEIWENDTTWAFREAKFKSALRWHNCHFFEIFFESLNGAVTLVRNVWKLVWATIVSQSLTQMGWKLFISSKSIVIHFRNDDAITGTRIFFFFILKRKSDLRFTLRSRLFVGICSYWSMIQLFDYFFQRRRNVLNPHFLQHLCAMNVLRPHRRNDPIFGL